MRMKIALLLITSCGLLVSSAQSGGGGDGDGLGVDSHGHQLKIEPQGTIRGGDTINLDLGRGVPGELVLMALGLEKGVASFGAVTLNVIPLAIIPLGWVNVEGTLQRSTTMSDPISPALSGLDIHLQSFGIQSPSGELGRSTIHTIKFE